MGYINPIAATEASEINGPRGTRLQFRIGASIELATSTFLFTQLGSTLTRLQSVEGELQADKTFYFIDTFVRVTGATTGYRLDVPVRFVKFKS